MLLLLLLFTCSSHFTHKHHSKPWFLFIHSRMRFILILAHLVLALAFDEFSMPDADDAVLTGPNVVVNLSKENFTQFIQQNPVAVVEFYAPW